MSRQDTSHLESGTSHLGPLRHRKCSNGTRPIWARPAVEYVQTRYIPFGAALPQKMFKRGTSHLGPSAAENVQTGHVRFGPALPQKTLKRHTSPLGPPCRRKCSNGTRSTFAAALLQNMLMQGAGEQTIFATDRLIMVSDQS